MDTWNKSAQKFYDEFGDKKNSAAFITAYQKVLNRFPSTSLLTDAQLASDASPLRAGAEVHRLPSTSKVLDLGCGTGELALVLSEAGFQMTGIDISQKSLAKAKILAPAVKFAEVDMTALTFKDHLFDAAFAMTSLEFCRDKNKALAEIKRVLKPGGLFYVEVRNRDFVLNFISGKLRGLLIQRGLLKTYPVESFEDLSYHEWLRLFSEAGFKLEREYPSLRPWAYGGLLTRTKNLLIELCKFLFPMSRQYMTAFLLRPI